MYRDFHVTHQIPSNPLFHVDYKSQSWTTTDIVGPLVLISSL